MPQKRRIPTQKRSREKYDAILSTAKALIGERGNDSVSMREIAKEAELPISSIYQYFPDKSAILGAIMQGYFDDIREMIKRFLGECKSIDDFQNGLITGIDLFYSLFKNDTALASLWAGMQANNELKELDAEDSRINARLITETLTSIIKDKEESEIYSAILLFLYTTGMTVRLALTIPAAEGDKLIEELKLLAKLRIEALEQASP
ncbi:MAG: TetR/AcrR family transcriptional regulator [Pseudomonadales bacterium]|nr:TetR/AcrR family transcriptional regulator [Pseudomonadales bacterium]